MKTNRFSEPQILAILRQAEGGVPVPELCREHGMSAASFYKRRSKYGHAAWRATTVRSRGERRRRLADRLAVSAGKFFPYGFDHNKPARDLLQRFGHILAQLGKPGSATACTGAGRIDDHTLAFYILRPRLSHRPLACERTYARGLGGSSLRCNLVLCRGHHQLLELQFHLVKQSRGALGTLSAKLPPQLFDRQLQFGDQRLAVGQHRLGIGGLRHRNVPLGDDSIALGNNAIMFSLQYFTLGKQRQIGARKVRRKIQRLRSHEAIRSD
ncbi:transposase [Rhizobium sp. PP-CC-3G-465]|nr:transposase [Rhizobium sp. PP-CC-3G-465]